jgi:DNA-binding transcriptional ArsR family regulator
MGYQATLEILADPTRRTIVERLKDGPQTVGALALGLPVSRPAVSKHLRLMKEAGVVRMTEDGTRNLYSLDLKAIEQVRRYLDSFWDDALARFKAAAEKPTGSRGKGANR